MAASDRSSINAALNFDCAEECEAMIPDEDQIRLYKFHSETLGIKYFVKKRSKSGDLWTLLASFMEAYALSRINSPYVIRLYGMDCIVEGIRLRDDELKRMLASILALMRKMDSLGDFKELTRYPCGYYSFIQLERTFAHGASSVCLNLEAHFIDNDTSTLPMSNLGYLHERIKENTGKHKDTAFFARILWQTLQAVRDTRQAGFYNCDLKPANFLIDGGDNVKLADFDVAQADEFRPIKGRTEDYYAPEFNDRECYKATEKSEVYSLGKTWDAIVRRRTDDDSQLSKDKSKEAPPLRMEAMYEGARPFHRLIVSMTSRNPTQRPTLAAIQEDPVFHGDVRKRLEKEDSEKRKRMPRAGRFHWPREAEVECNLRDGCRWCRKSLCCCCF